MHVQKVVFQWLARQIFHFDALKLDFLLTYFDWCYSILELIVKIGR